MTPGQILALICLALFLALITAALFTDGDDFPGDN